MVGKQSKKLKKTRNNVNGKYKSKKVTKNHNNNNNLMDQIR